MDASYKIQRGIHVHLIQFFMCPEFWVHISPLSIFLRFYRKARCFYSGPLVFRRFSALDQRSVVKSGLWGYNQDKIKTARQSRRAGRNRMDARYTGEQIAAARRAKGLTQKQLADALGVTDKAVSKWERGESNK